LSTNVIGIGARETSSYDNNKYDMAAGAQKFYRRLKNRNTKILAIKL